ncbi:MAG: ATP synthase F1 subunit gamma [Candidatus Bipolaricaulia bacterium]
MAQHVRAIKGRIGNIEDIAQITRAMNAIAMTKVARMKRRLEQTRPYMAALESFLVDAIGRLPAEGERNPLLVENKGAETGILVLNADRGLCGRYKGDLNRRAGDLLREAGPAGRLLAGGEKAHLHFERRGVEPLRSYSRLYDAPTYKVAVKMADDLIGLYRDGQVCRIDLVYMRFVSDLKQRMVVERFLPIAAEPKDNDALSEPTASELVDDVLPTFLRGKLYEAILETKASEDAIRRQAMKNATDNAEDILKTLTLSYNKARQQSITREIADIIGGAEALRDR